MIYGMAFKRHLEHTVCNRVGNVCTSDGEVLVEITREVHIAWECRLVSRQYFAAAKLGLVIPVDMSSSR